MHEINLIHFYSADRSIIELRVKSLIKDLEPFPHKGASGQKYLKSAKYLPKSFAGCKIIEF